jgi:hypothetical protein
MKRIFTLCCVCLTLVAAVCAQEEKGRAARAPQTADAPPLEHGGKIESNYDGFAYETVVALKSMRVTCAPAEGSERVKGVCVSLQAALHCPGKQLDYVRRATIRLTFETKNWDRLHPPEERGLTAVADGETLRLGRMTLVSKGVGEGWVDANTKETLEAAVTYETFLKLARASYVELSVGRTTFALSDKNVAALRDMKNRVRLPRAAGEARPGGSQARR